MHSELCACCHNVEDGQAGCVDYFLEVPLEPLERRKNYHALFVHRVDGELLEEIRANTNKGLAVGA